MRTLVFPQSGECLTTAFNNAIEEGVIQRENSAKTDYWARHEYLAFDIVDGVDIFWNELAGQYVRVPRKGFEI